MHKQIRCTVCEKEIDLDNVYSDFDTKLTGHRDCLIRVRFTYGSDFLVGNYVKSSEREKDAN